MTRAELIAEPDTLEFIVAPSENVTPAEEPDAVLPVSVPYEIWYYRSGRLPEINMGQYPYTSIPKCFGLLSAEALEDTGIFRLQNLPGLALTGEGVFVAIIDTGIDYLHPAFLDEDGFSRIRAIWDQTAAGAEEKSVPYGRVYDNSRINQAIKSENPYEQIPQTDTEGHGTLLAGIAAGSPNPSAGFVGAAPGAELVVVKLRQAKPYLRKFFFIPEDVPVYAESDILSALSFAEELAEKDNRPCVFLIGVGANNGSHSGTGPLCEALDILGLMQRKAVVAATGNEGGKRHHFFGRTDSVLVPRKAEISVEKDMSGLYLEFWGLSPEQYSISVLSPTGELLGRSGLFSQASQKVTFLFEETTLTVDYQAAGQSRRDQLIFLRFSNIKRGIWTIRVYPENAINGFFHMWLPMEEMLESPVVFLEPDPDVTLTSPSDGGIPMGVGGINGLTGGLYTGSGRGFDADGKVKPDFVAPAVNLLTAEAATGGYVSFSGTSASAALAAGACAQLLEWAVVRGRAPTVNSVDIKNLLIRGALRKNTEEYPSTTFGYGMMQVYDAFERLRRRP